MYKWIIAIGILLLTGSLHGEAPPCSWFEKTTGNLQGELAKAKQSGKKGVLVMFELNGCGECQKVKETLLKEPSVQRYYQAHFHNISLFVDNLGPLTDFTGKPTTQSEFANANRVIAAPTFIFYDIDGYPVTRFTGAARDTDEFITLGRYVAEAAYETMPFGAYRQTAQ